MWASVYAFGFLDSFYLDQFLWIVYLLHLGYGVALIGLGYAVLQAGRIAFDVPSSLLADRFGGRVVLAAGAVAKVVGAVLFLFAGRGYGYMLVGCLVTSLALTLPSGVDLAYVRAVTGAGSAPEGAASRRFMGYVAMQYLASLIAAALGGLIATRSFSQLYEADAAAGVLMLAVALALPRTAPVGRAQRVRLRTAFKTLVGAARPGFWLLGLSTALLWACSSVATDYSQTLLFVLRLRPYAISLAFAGAGVLAWLTTLAAGRATGRVQERLLRWGVLGYPAAAAVRAAAAVVRQGAAAVAVGGIGLGRATSGVSGLLDQRLLDAAPEGLQATALSVIMTVQLGLIMVLYPALGLVAGGAGLGAVFLILSAGLLACSLVVMKAVRAQAEGDRVAACPASDGG